MRFQFVKLTYYVLSLGLLTSGLALPVVEPNAGPAGQERKAVNVRSGNGKSFLHHPGQAPALLIRDLHVHGPVSSPIVTSTAVKRARQKSVKVGHTSKVKSPSGHSKRKKGSTHKAKGKNVTKGTSKHKKAGHTSKVKSSSGHSKGKKGSTRKAKGKGVTKGTSKHKKAGKKDDLEFTNYVKKPLKFTPPVFHKKATSSKRDQSAVERRSDAVSLEHDNAEKRADDPPRRGTPPHVVKVEAGELKPGSHINEMRTWGLKNCWGLMAYDVATGQKAMAHVNGRNRLRKNYDVQVDAFTELIATWQGPVEVYVRWPHDSAWPSDPELRRRHGYMDDYFRDWWTWLGRQRNYRLVVLPARMHTGDMRLLDEGDTVYDE